MTNKIKYKGRIYEAIDDSVKDKLDYIRSYTPYKIKEHVEPGWVEMKPGEYGYPGSGAVAPDGYKWFRTGRLIKGLSNANNIFLVKVK